MSDTANDTRISVWDPLVRVGHWALVAAFTIAYLTGEEDSQAGDWHEWAGYAAGAIVVWRILWGSIGPQYARFREFAVWPHSALVYLIDLVAGRSRRYVGHSPAGGVMIVALLALIAATVITGIIADQDGNASKAQAGVTALAQVQMVEAGKTARNAEALKGEHKESFIGDMHGTLANITLILVGLHILGVLLASFVHHENLVTAMITGKKRREDAL